MRLSAAQAVEVALERARTVSDVVDLVAVGTHDSSATLRWANNTLTTNGYGWGTDLTLVAFVAVTGGGIATATVSESDPAFDVAFVHRLVDRVIAAARRAEAAHHGLTLPGTVTYGNWDAAPYETDLDVLAQVTPRLGEVLARGARLQRNHSGYAEHTRASSWIASLSGLRLREDDQDGRLEMTCRADGGGRSVWEGRHTRSFGDVDVLDMDAKLDRQLAWQQVRRDLAPGRYRAILPPGPVGDLMAAFDANLVGRDAVEGSGPFARPDGRTMIGERIAGQRDFDVFSDPHQPGVQSMPYVVDVWDSSMTSVFDTGQSTQRTHWVRDGRLEALCTSRAVAAEHSLAYTPNVPNLVLEVQGGHGSLDEVIARTESGLLINTLWYIRDLDEATMTVTGTTRDGVYEVRDGQVVGVVNNFRFNESPLGVLSRISDAGSPELCQPRENAESVSDYLMPTLVVDDFNMSSVSEAS